MTWWICCLSSSVRFLQLFVETAAPCQVESTQTKPPQARTAHCFQAAVSTQPGLGACIPFCWTLARAPHACSPHAGCLDRAKRRQFLNATATRMFLRHPYGDRRRLLGMLQLILGTAMLHCGQPLHNNSLQGWRCSRRVARERNNIILSRIGKEQQSVPER